jgi:Tol biopolymer transport system component
MDFVNCPACQTLNPPGSVRCGQCKADIPEPPPPAPPSTGETTPAEPAAVAAPTAPEASPPPFVADDQTVVRVQALETQIAAKPGARALYLQLAQIYIDGGRPELAIAVFERCLKVDPANVLVRHKLAQLTGRPDKPLQLAPAPGGPVRVPAMPAPAFASRTGAYPRPVPRRSASASKKRLLVGGGVAVALVLVWALYFLLTRPTLLVSGPFRAFAPQWSPTGKQFAFLVNDGQTTQLGVYDVRQKSQRMLAEVQAWDDSGFAWSPDGARIVYTARGSQREWGEAVWLLDVGSGQKRLLAKGDSPAWGSDGQTVVMTCEGEAKQTGLTVTSEDGEGAYPEMSWTPPQLCRVDSGTGAVHRTQYASPSYGMRFSPVLEQTLYEEDAPAAPPAPSGTQPGAAADPDAGGLVDTLTAGGGPRTMGEASHDLSRELKARQYTERKRKATGGALALTGNIFVADLRGSAPRQLTSDGRAGFPQWTPDGRRIIYGATGATGTEFWVMDADGTNRRLLLPASVKGVDPTSIVLTRDGRQLLFVAGVEGDPGLARLMTGESPADLHTARLGGGGLKRLSNRHSFKQRFALSPDGKRIVYEVLQDVTMLGGAKRSELWLMSR